VLVEKHTFDIGRIWVYWGLRSLPAVEMTTEWKVEMTKGWNGRDDKTMGSQIVECKKSFGKEFFFRFFVSLAIVFSFVLK
jgi:hypothetical protein